ncbi:hypothetical protein [Flavobacterium restrictum]|nr:hypothetical protein [Flavobacterium restrictum]
MTGHVFIWFTLGNYNDLVGVLNHLNIIMKQNETKIRSSIS